jgi:hypothetical protein
MAATRSALSWKVSTSRSMRPNSLTSSAPATWKRSVMTVFISAFSPMPSRERAWSRRPTMRAGMMNSGSREIAISVTRHSRVNITIRVIVTPMRLSTIPPSVPVKARCAPITSLFSRVISDPVWVRVKKAIGIVCTCR